MSSKKSPNFWDFGFFGDGVGDDTERVKQWLDENDCLEVTDGQIIRISNIIDLTKYGERSITIKGRVSRSNQGVILFDKIVDDSDAMPHPYTFGLGDCFYGNDSVELTLKNLKIVNGWEYLPFSIKLKIRFRQFLKTTSEWVVKTFVH